MSKDDEESKQRIIEIFNKHDSDGDGTLSKGELRTVFLACGTKPHEIDEIFRRVDKDGDGKVSYKEFLDWIFSKDDAAAAVKEDSFGGPKTADQALQQFVELLQGIAREERESVKDKYLKPAGKVLGLKYFFDKIDMNGSGKISGSEFKAGVKSLGFDPPGGDWIKEVFKLIDGSTDKKGRDDQQITFKEFKKTLKEAGFGAAAEGEDEEAK